MIKVEHLTKCYGDFTAVDDLSFEIGEGQVYGFLGPNGAGKTTTMNILTGCLSATRGRVEINGYDVFQEPNQAKRSLGYLPEQPPLYLNESPLEYLRFVGRMKGLRGEELDRQVAEAVQRTGIDAVKHRRISTLSKGFRQRVGIAQALLGDPKVIILDEPTVGLDPIQIIEIRDLIRELGQRHTVIFSSHILSEMQTVCQKILILSRGKLIAFDTPQNLENRRLAPHEIALTVEASPARAREVLAGLTHIRELALEEGGGYTQIRVSTDYSDVYQASRELFTAFAAGGTVLLEMALKRAGLEEIFLELTDSGSGTAEDPGAAGTPGGGRKGEDGT